MAIGAFAPAWTEPFPGLRPFDQSERDLFFGRDQVVEDIVGRVLDARFAAVVGSSGSGKSSTIRAGVLPQMQGADNPWRIVVMRPGTRPLDALAEALSDQGVDDAQAAIRASSRGLSVAAAQLSGQLLVVVDQFEELFRFRLARDRDEQAMFVSALLEAAADSRGQVAVLITMHSGFIGECEEFRGLPDAVNRGMYLMPRMTRNELRDAIEGPVGVAGADVSPRLVQTILNDAAAESFSLGLVQHAMRQTWRAWLVRECPGPMDLPDYESVERLSRALENHADRTFDRLDKDEQSVFPRALVSLAEQTPGGGWFRSPRPLEQVVALAGADHRSVTRALYRFADEQFLTIFPPAGDTGGVAESVPARIVTDQRTIVDLTSELLITRWPRFAEWLQVEAQDRQTYIRLVETADLYAKAQAGLLTDPELSITLAWREHRNPSARWAERLRPGFEQAMLFLEQSARAARRRRLTRAVLLSAAMSLILVLLLAFLQ